MIRMRLVIGGVIGGKDRSVETATEVRAIGWEPVDELQVVAM